MKIEYAFSLDYGDIVDAEEAYDLYWADIIRHKRNFECISDNCSAEITCANLDRLRKDMKMIPHFRLVGEHSENCSYQKYPIKDYSSQASNNISDSRGYISNERPDILELERPREHQERKKISHQLHQQSSLIRKRKKKSYNSSNLSRSQKYYSIKNIIDKFYQYRQEQCLESKFIEIKKYKISYAEMFVKIDGQNLEHLLPKYKRVYWGEANLYDNETHYNLRFLNYFTLNGKNFRPSIYISHEIIEAAFCSKLIKKKIKNMSGSSIYCFVYSRPYIKPTNNGKNYINFYIENLDFLEIKKEF